MPWLALLWERFRAGEIIFQTGGTSVLAGFFVSG